jgi:hypothetical protein
MGGESMLSPGFPFRSRIKLERLASSFGQLLRRKLPKSAMSKLPIEVVSTVPVNKN